MASGRKHRQGGEKILVVGARKVHLHATPVRDVFVELPSEIRRSGTCGHLKRRLNGTRDAPARWEAFLASELKKHGFVQGAAGPCCFYHPTKELRCVVHGDDFVFAGVEEALKWVEARMH